MVPADPAATAATTSATDAGCLASGGVGSLFLIYAVVIGMFYLLFIRPNNKRKKQEEELRKSIEVGDEVITEGGVIARVVSVKENEFIVIETGADRTKLKVKPWAIVSNDTARERIAALQPQQPQKKGFLENLFGKKESDSDSSDSGMGEQK
ncbi:MAG: preprotein translocase subunit YajC [Ruminococcaceae bacterium]|nr:preprotein translocase subunit YajC [Oscillospiraceae bacterium]